MVVPPVLLVTKGLDFGGIERIVADLAAGLRRRGVDVDVAVVNERRSQLADAVTRSGARLIGLGGSDKVGVSAAWRLARLARSGSYGVVHVHGPLPAVVLRSVPGGAPVVTTSHTMWGSLRRSTRVLWHLTASRDAVTVAVSSAVMESLPARVSRRTHVVPHGIDVAAIERARATMPREPSADVIAICVASHRDVKNYPNLLRAFAAARRTVPALRLVAVGDGPDVARHRQLAAELGLDDAVSFEPATPEVLERMAAADLLVVASDFEGQPLVVMEAMALGLPVVATAVGRVPELLGPAEGRIVSPGDSNALAAALVEVASNSDLRCVLGERARVVSGSWTLEDVIDAYLGLYSSAASGGATSAG